jgi:hypothetical protein
MSTSIGALAGASQGLGAYGFRHHHKRLWIMGLTQTPLVSTPGRHIGWTAQIARYER